jgi:hypothetical protein
LSRLAKVVSDQIATAFTTDRSAIFIARPTGPEKVAMSRDGRAPTVAAVDREAG